MSEWVLEGRHSCNGGAPLHDRKSASTAAAVTTDAPIHTYQNVIVNHSKRTVQSTVCERQDMAQKCVQHRSRTPLTLGATAELGKNQEGEQHAYVTD